MDERAVGGSVENHQVTGGPVRKLFSESIPSRRPWVLVAVLSVPALGILARIAFTPWSAEVFAGVMHSSGEMAARLLVVSLLATPLLRVWPRARLTRWLRRNRRTFGVASFAYGVLHASVYLCHKPWAEIVEDLGAATYLLGWMAFLVMVPLALTSFDAAQKRLGRRWITLHRLAYVAAIAGCLHWLLNPIGRTLGPVMVHFLPLALLEANRVRRRIKRRA